jgi:transposase
MARRKRRSLTAEYKAEVVALVRKSGKGMGVIAKERGLTETAVRAWVRRADVDSGEGPSGTLMTAEREEFARLRKQVKTLEMEREIRKEATASFGSESK